MQKFVELKSLGTKLQIISAFAVDHVKGFIYIEAHKQCDINEVTYIFEYWRKLIMLLLLMLGNLFLLPILLLGIFFWVIVIISRLMCFLSCLIILNSRHVKGFVAYTPLGLCQFLKMKSLICCPSKINITKLPRVCGLV